LRSKPGGSLKPYLVAAVVSTLLEPSRLPFVIVNGSSSLQDILSTLAKPEKKSNDRLTILPLNLQHTVKKSFPDKKSGPISQAGRAANTLHRSELITAASCGYRPAVVTESW
jgi:precorrin-2 methylase